MSIVSLAPEHAPCQYSHPWLLNRERDYLLLFYDGHCVRLRLSDADDSRLGSFGVELPAGLNGDREPIVEENGQQE